MKFVANHLVAIHNVAVGPGSLPFARKMGLDPRQVWDLFAAGPSSGTRRFRSCAAEALDHSAATTRSNRRYAVIGDMAKEPSATRRHVRRAYVLQLRRTGMTLRKSMTVLWHRALEPQLFSPGFAGHLADGSEGGRVFRRPKNSTQRSRVTGSRTGEEEDRPAQQGGSAQLPARRRRSSHGINSTSEPPSALNPIDDAHQCLLDRNVSRRRYHHAAMPCGTGLDHGDPAARLPRDSEGGRENGGPQSSAFTSRDAADGFAIRAGYSPSGAAGDECREVRNRHQLAEAGTIPAAMPALLAEQLPQIAGVRPFTWGVNGRLPVRSRYRQIISVRRTA